MKLHAPKLPDPARVTESIATWAAANPLFAQALNAGTPPARALMRLGLQFVQDNRVVDAVTVFHAAVALEPENAELWLNFGASLDRAGAFPEAAGSLNRSVELSRQQPDTWLLLGLVLKKLGDLAACEAAYRASLDLDPNSAVAWQCLGLLKQDQRDYSAAIDCLNKSLKHGESTAATQANLGKLNYEIGRIKESCAAFSKAAAQDESNAHYRQMARKTRFIQDVLAGESVDNALNTYQRTRGTEDQKKDISELLKSAFSQLSGFGHLEAARKVGRKHLELEPGNRVVEYLLQAVDGDPGLARSPQDFVVDLFNSFAEGFDAQLVGVLNYDVPAKICTAVREAMPAGQLYDIVDVGCGTGLCGPLLRPFARELIGLDLAPKILEQARKRGVYDQLICEELTAFLNRSPERFDLIMAADVLIYIGDLAPVFSAAAAALKPNGLLAFSTETGADHNYRLQPSGRFTHSPEFIRSLAQPAFTEHNCIDTTIRLEANRRVPGQLFLFRKK